MILAVFLLVIFSTSAFAVEDPDKYKLYKFTYREADDCSCSVGPDICGGGNYLWRLQRRIQFAWHPPTEPNTEKVVVRFRIHKNGRVSNIKLVSDNKSPLSPYALKAIQDAAPFSMLPKDAPENVDMQFTFPTEHIVGRLRNLDHPEQSVEEKTVPYTSQFRPHFNYFQIKLAPYLMSLQETIRHKWKLSEGNKSKVVIGFTMNAEGKLYDYVLLTQAQDRSTQVMFDIIKESNPIDLPPGLPGEIRIKFTFDPTIREPYISEAQLIKPPS